MKIWNHILNLLYPNVCCFCEKTSPTPICDGCKEKLTYVQEPKCKSCGKPVRYAEQELCYDCQKTKHYYVQGKSLWLHQGVVSQAVYRFKYRNRRVFGEFYARELYQRYGVWIRQCGIEVIVPVPLHWFRRRSRGYNQAEILAKRLGALTGIPVDTKAICRRYATKPQKILNHRERKKNLSRAFVYTAKWQRPKRILIVDDIYTTGSTVDAIAKEFQEKGNSKVWFLTISIGQDF